MHATRTVNVHTKEQIATYLRKMPPWSREIRSTQVCAHIHSRIHVERCHIRDMQRRHSAEYERMKRIHTCTRFFATHDNRRRTPGRESWNTPQYGLHPQVETTTGHVAERITHRSYIHSDINLPQKKTNYNKSTCKNSKSINIINYTHRMTFIRLDNGECSIHDVACAQWEEIRQCNRTIYRYTA